MNIDQFKELFDSLSQISLLNFEVWDRKEQVFSSGLNGKGLSISRQIQDFSTHVIHQAAFQHSFFGNRQAIFGIPIRNEDEIIGTLLAYHTSSGKKLNAKAIDSLRIPYVKDMETLLSRLAGFIEDKLISEKEKEEMATELSQSFEDLYLYSRIAIQIKTLRFSSSMLNKLVEDILKTMRVDLAFVMMPDRQDNNVSINNKKKYFKIHDMESFIENLLKAIPIDAPSLAENYFIVDDSLSNHEYSEFHAQPYRFLAVRIQHDSNSYGWLGIVSFNLKENFRRSELKLLTSMAEQLAIVIANTDLYHDLERFLINMIKSLVYAIEAKDVYTRGHSERVSDICMLMANRLALGKEEKNDLHWASILHDVGKIGVPEKILNKVGPLDDKEYEIIKEHPAKGYNILKPIDQLTDVLPSILHHHERYDGRGYPNGLKGEEIPLTARIISVVDTFDAITSRRAYRSARAPEEALKIIEDVAGTQLDPYLVSVFKDLLNKDLEFGKEGFLGKWRYTVDTIDY